MECCKITGRKICVGKEIKKKPAGTIGPAKGCFEKWGIGGRNVGKRGKKKLCDITCQKMCSNLHSHP
jgi:hypothetical protein